MALTFVDRIAGKFKRFTAAVTATANSIVGTGSDGRIDVSFLPVGVGPEVKILPSSENLAAGNFVNVYTNSGVATVRKADATTAGKGANGFVLAATTSPASATVYFESNINNQLSGLTPGADYWLDTTAGAITSTPPAAAGNNSQFVGKALSATELVFTKGEEVEL